MSIPQPSVDVRAPARVAHASTEEPVAEESLWAHARRVLRSRVSAAATAVLDAGIALLQWLRKRAGGAQDPDAEAGEGRPRSRTDRPAGRRDAAAHSAEVEAEAEAPKPRRRVRAFFVYLSILLAGGMGGGALAYDLLAKLLDRQAVESRRLEAAASKQAKAAATVQKKLEDAEKKLEVSLAEYTKSAAEKQKKLDEAEKRPVPILAAEGAGQAPRPSPGSAGREPRPPKTPLKTGDCTLVGSGNVAALKDCVADFNR